MAIVQVFWCTCDAVKCQLGLWRGGEKNVATWKAGLELTYEFREKLENEGHEWDK